MVTSSWEMISRRLPYTSFKRPLHSALLHSSINTRTRTNVARAVTGYNMYPALSFTSTPVVPGLVSKLLAEACMRECTAASSADDVALPRALLIRALLWYLSVATGSSYCSSFW